MNKISNCKSGSKEGRDETHHIGEGVISIHFGAELGVELGAAVDGAGGETMRDNGNDLERDGAHVEEHAGDVEERGE